MKQLKIGDVVQLASGGPKMTVTSEDKKTDRVFCEWILEDGSVKTHAFPEDALIKALGSASAGQP